MATAVDLRDCARRVIMDAGFPGCPRRRRTAQRSAASAAYIGAQAAWSAMPSATTAPPIISKSGYARPWIAPKAGMLTRGPGGGPSGSKPAAASWSTQTEPGDVRTWIQSESCGGWLRVGCVCQAQRGGIGRDWHHADPPRAKARTVRHRRKPNRVVSAQRHWNGLIHPGRGQCGKEWHLGRVGR